jgi:predicted DNA-binding transcriptional regulator AlpA
MKKLKQITVHQIYDRFLTTTEAAEFLSLSPATLNTYRSRDEGPRYHRIDDRTIRYPFSAIIEYAGKEVCTGRDSTSVHKQCFISLLLNNTRLKNEVQTILNNEAIRAVTFEASKTVKASCEKRIEKLNWALDKLTLNFELPKKLGRQFELKLSKKEEEYLAVYQPKRIAYYQSMYRIKLSRKSEIAITLLYSNTESCFNYRFQVQITPSQFNKKRTATLCKMFRYFFGQEYKAALLNAWVSRFDICFDLPSANNALTIFRLSGTNKRLLVQTGAGNNTVYKVEGSRRRNRCKSYTKNGGTRVEFEFYPKSKTLKLEGLLEYEAPFKRFELYDPRFLLVKGLHPHTINAIDVLGLSGAIKTINDPKERRILKKALKDHRLVTSPQQFQQIARRKIRRFLKCLVL